MAVLEEVKGTAAFKRFEEIFPDKSKENEAFAKCTAFIWAASRKDIHNAQSLLKYQLVILKELAEKNKAETSADESEGRN